MEKSKSKPWKDWRIWVAIVLILVVVSSFIFKGPISLTDVLSSLKTFPLEALLTAGVLCSVQVLVMGFRVWALTPKGTRPVPVLWAIAYGQFANSFFPARAGDALKVAILSDSKKGAQMTVTSAAGVLVGDRPVDIVALLLWITFSGAYATDAFKSEKMPNISSILLGVLAAVALVLVVFKLFLKGRKFALLSKAGEFFKSAGSFLNVRQGVPSFFFGLLTWLFEFLALLVLVRSIGYPLTLAQVITVIAILNLAIALPISVANVGPFEASMTYALTKFGVPAATGLSIAILHHAFQVLGTCVATLALALTQKLSRSSGLRSVSLFFFLAISFSIH